jgi:V/A-type H+-transporting ATPase subunit E
MPLEKLIERILRDAEEKAEHIRSEAQMRRREVISEANREAEARYHRMVNEARRTWEEEKKQRVTMAALEARKSILEQKQELIQEVFDRTLGAMRDMPEDQYVDLIIRLLLVVVEDTGGELVMSSRDRERIGEEIISKANTAFEQAGKRGRITLSSETRDISAGFVLQAEGVEINSSVEALISSKREELEPEVVRILFGGPETGVRI